MAKTQDERKSFNGVRPSSAGRNSCYLEPILRGIEYLVFTFAVSASCAWPESVHLVQTTVICSAAKDAI